jgi:hypothetical protein
MTWGNHIDDLCSSWVSDRARTSNNEDRSCVYTLVVLDPVMVVFRTVKDSDRSFERHEVIWIREVLLGKGRRNDRSLHDRTVEQGALEMEESGGGLHWLVERPNHARVGCKVAFTVFTHRLAGNGQCVWMRQSVVLHEFRNNGYRLDTAD